MKMGTTIFDFLNNLCSNFLLLQKKKMGKNHKHDF